MRVWNRNLETAPPGAIYIGRGTPWGNPFIIGINGTREEVVSQFRHWLQSQPALVERMRRELAGRDLVCSCKPLLCHGDVIVEVVTSAERALESKE